MFYAFGKRFRITAVFFDDNQANAYLERHPGEGAIDCDGPRVIIAEFKEAERGIYL